MICQKRCWFKLLIRLYLKFETFLGNKAYTFVAFIPKLMYFLGFHVHLKFNFFKLLR